MLVRIVFTALAIWAFISGAHAQQERIAIVSSAFYKCAQQSLDVSTTVRQSCAGKSSCTISINNRNMGGDPCRGEDKTLEVQFSCTSGSSFLSTCNEYNHMLVSCPPRYWPGTNDNCKYDYSLDGE